MMVFTSCSHDQLGSLPWSLPSLNACWLDYSSDCPTSRRWCQGCHRGRFHALRQSCFLLHLHYFLHRHMRTPLLFNSDYFAFDQHSAWCWPRYHQQPVQLAAVLFLGSGPGHELSIWPARGCSDLLGSLVPNPNPHLMNSLLRRHAS